MIIINEVAETLEKLLNGDEYSTLGYTRPNDFMFSVATNGFHLDRIANKKERKNFIPCFLSQTGGEYDPIPNLQKQAISFNLTMYFPVRYKKAFYEIGNFLASALVGKVRSWGDASGDCLSTIDPAVFGEITTQDLTQFKSWVSDTYQEEINVSENFISMSIDLYLTSSLSSYYGNNAKVEFGFKYQASFKYVEVKWVSQTQTQDNTPSSQQLLGTDKYSKSIINSTANAYSIQFILTDDTKYLLQNYANSSLNDDLYSLRITIGDIVITRSVVILNFQPLIAYGQLISLVLTLGDA